jgi:phage terminase small subunit
MNERQRRFVTHYLACRNASEAARRAGYAPSCAASHAAQMRRMPEIAAALKAAGGDPAEHPLPRELTARQLRFVEEYAALPNATRAARRAGYGRGASAPRGHMLLRNPRVIAALRERGVEIVYGAFARDPEDRTRPQRKDELNARQKRFVAEYLASGRAKEAALRAGYTKRHPSVAAGSLLRNPLVAAAIAKGRAEITEKLHVDAARVIEEFARLAFADLADYVEWGPDGLRLKPQSELGKHASAALIELVERKNKRGTRLTVKLNAKLKALEALGKYLGLFPRANAAKGARPAPPAPGASGADAMAKLDAILKRPLPKPGG